MASCCAAPCLFPTTGLAPQTFASALQYFAAAQCLLTEKVIPESDVKGSDSFDFIIIGAGSTGSVVANRLSEVKDWNILLIEAGTDAPVESKVPGFSRSLFYSNYDWQYFTVNNSVTSQAILNGSVGWNRGKMLGGSSNINGMIYLQGNDKDYQSWYDEGNKEWSVSNVRRSFRKAESFQNARLLQNSIIKAHYGHNGPLVINHFNSTYNNHLKNIINSWDEIGFRKVPDLNIENVMTSGFVTATAANGVRQSTEQAYLRPIIHRTNLKIIKGALVTKILIDENLKAYGVEVEKSGDKMSYYASTEVILSAGAINSPKLLMLSGIGPEEHLQSKNITCKANSPKVGQNLQDHAAVPITIYGDLPGEITAIEKNIEIIDYLANHKKFLAQSDLLTDAVALYSTVKKSTYSNSQNHLSIVPRNASDLKDNLVIIHRYNATVVDSMVKLNEKYGLYYFLYTLLHPYSRGNISLSSKNFKDAPLIYSNYFYDTRDLETAAKGIKMATKILKTSYFQHIYGFLGRMNVPACNNLLLDSKDYWKCISLNLVTTIYHPVGTCKMGSNILMSVVDSRLKVHGIRNLRVVDASVMPTITSGNTNGPSIMIGERASDLIKEDYNKV